MKRTEDSQKKVLFGLAGVKAEGVVDGLMLQMHVSHHYVNHTKKPLELVYTFPFSFKATLLECGCVIGDKVMKGAVKCTDAAEQEYEEAVGKGDSAFKLEQNANGALTGRLGNLAPNEAATVTITYAEPLSIVKGNVRLCLPLLIDDEVYGDPTPVFNDPDNVPVTDPNAHYGFEMHLAVKGQLAKAQVAVTSHPASFVKVTETGIDIETRFKPLDRDWVCVFDHVDCSQGTLLLERAKEGFVAAAAFVVPYAKNKRTRAPISTKVLIDCSGSMSGSGIGMADLAFKHFIERMDPHDCVSLTKFGSDAEDVFDMREVCNWKLKRMLRRNRLVVEADMGGTELGGALDHVYGMGADLTNSEARAYGTPILLITDGEVYQTEEIVSRAVASGHRLHILCIGMGSNPGWLKKIADLTNGSLTCITEGEDVEAAIDEIADRLMGGIVRDVKVCWNQPLSALPSPNTTYAGETVWSYAVMKDKPEGLLKVNTANGEINLSWPTTEVENGETLARLFAKERMLSETDEEKRTQIATDYALISEHTQWILTAERKKGEKLFDELETVIVAQPEIATRRDPEMYYCDSFRKESPLGKASCGSGVLKSVAPSCRPRFGGIFCKKSKMPDVCLGDTLYRKSAPLLAEPDAKKVIEAITREDLAQRLKDGNGEATELLIRLYDIESIDMFSSIIHWDLDVLIVFIVDFIRGNLVESDLSTQDSDPMYGKDSWSEKRVFEHLKLHLSEWEK